MKVEASDEAGGDINLDWDVKVRLMCHHVRFYFDLELVEAPKLFVDAVNVETKRLSLNVVYIEIPYQLASNISVSPKHRSVLKISATEVYPRLIHNLMVSGKLEFKQSFLREEILLDSESWVVLRNFWNILVDCLRVIYSNPNA